MKELLEDIIKAIVDDVDAVKVNILDTESTTIYELHVAKDDVGKVIGKKGRNITALRIILSAGTSKAGDKRALLEVVD
ncbi:MAG: KH domain-containing protein [Candidatus Marinimicrobia bacterium]|nr:KH domain-containing protein [Candidatus Neomarinimicrobiota bacterium]